MTIHRWRRWRAYQFVTNLYQAFGLSFVSVISQDAAGDAVLSAIDAKRGRYRDGESCLAGGRPDRAEQSRAAIADEPGIFSVDGWKRSADTCGTSPTGSGLAGADELMLEERWVRMGRDAYSVRPQLRRGNRRDSPGMTRRHQRLLDKMAQGRSQVTRARPGLQEARRRMRREILRDCRAALRNDNAGQGAAAEHAPGPPAETAGAPWATKSFLSGTICAQCGAALGLKDFRPAPLAPVPQGVGTRRVANGQEVISIIGGLELNTPVWANEQYEFPYLQWQMEVHRAKLNAAFPQAADKIQTGGPQAADDIYARADAQVAAVAQGMPTTHPGDALFNLITFSAHVDQAVGFLRHRRHRRARSASADVSRGLLRGVCGRNVLRIAQRNDGRLLARDARAARRRAESPKRGRFADRGAGAYNLTLSNIQAETYEYGIPPIYADPQVLDFDALSNQTAEPAAHYPARARPGMSLADGFFQPAPAQVPPDMLRHQQDLMGPIAQFLTGLFPAVFGGEMENVKTASGYAMARDQALGRLGLVWRRLKSFLLRFDAAGAWIASEESARRCGDSVSRRRAANSRRDSSAWPTLKGNIQGASGIRRDFPAAEIAATGGSATAHEQSRSDDSSGAARAGEPWVRPESLVGLSELVVPGDDARNKQLREVQILLTAGPVIMAQNELVSGRSEAPLSPAASEGEIPPAEKNGRRNDTASESGLRIVSTIPVDELMDDHATEFEECRRWASSDAGQIARAQNPAGFANVHAAAQAEHAGGTGAAADSSSGADSAAGGRSAA